MVGVHENAEQDEGRDAAADARHLPQDETDLRAWLGLGGLCLVTVMMKLLCQHFDEDDVDEDTSVEIQKD